MHQAVLSQPAASGGGGSGGGSSATSSNSSGNTTITPTSSMHQQTITVTGAARTSVFILATAGRAAGDRVFLRFVNPAIANIVEQIRNGAAGGTLIYSYTTDGSGTDNVAAELYFDGSAWQPYEIAVPVV